jgi:clan AA aspartic protease (TIGR02281 family)
MNCRRLLVGLAILAATITPAYAKEDTTQVQDATMFFNQLIKETKNPLVASLAQESLSRIKEKNVTSQRVEIPLLRRMNNSLTVPAMVNRSAMGTFIVDTGATYTVITPRLAQKLGVTVGPENQRISIITANGTISAPVVILNNVAIGGVEVSGVKAIVQDLGKDELLAGLLGMNFFKDMELTIKQNKLILSVSHAF